MPPGSVRFGQLAVAPAHDDELRGVGVPEGPLEALALAGAEAVAGDAEVLDSQELGHDASTSGAKPSSA